MPADRSPVPGTPDPKAIRFWTKVDKDGPVPEHRPELGPCWLWTAYRNPLGYGRYGVSRRESTLHSHRYAYGLLVGPVPDGLELDHLCRNPPCVNPAHLEPVTHKVNILRGNAPSAVNARKTHCKRGHEFTPENTKTRDRGGRVERTCRACLAARSAARRAS